MTLIARLVLALNAGVIGLIGLAYLYDPNMLLANYGLSTDSLGMDNMLRSTYGGLFLCVAGLFAFGALNADRRADAWACWPCSWAALLSDGSQALSWPAPPTLP